MKDLKIVIAIAVPLVLVAGGLYALQAFLDPIGDETGIVTPGPGGNSSRKPLHKDAVPREDWPKQEGAGVGPSAIGLAPMGERVPRDADDWPVLTLEVLRDLLGKLGDARQGPEAFKRLKLLLVQGQVEEPFEVAKLLMESLDKGGNYGHYCGKLLPLLKDERVRERIATDLLSGLSNFKDRNGIVGAIEVVGKVGGPGNVAALADIALKHEMRDAVARALYAMADIGGAEAAGALVGYLERNAGGSNEDLALRAIENLKTNEMVKAIDDLLSEGKPKDTRLLGVRALGMAAGTPTAAKRLLDLAKEGGEVGRAAGLQLGRVTGKEATDPFIERLDEVDDVHQRTGMVRALGTNGSEPARAKCFEVLSSVDERASVRAEGATSLAKMGDDRGVAVMIDIVTNPREDTRVLDRKILGAMQSLALKNREAGKEMSKKVLPALKKRLKDNPVDSSHHQLKITILTLEQIGNR